MQKFSQHLATFLDCVATGNKFALARFGDGEAAVIQRQEISAGYTNRPWSWRPSRGVGDECFAQELSASFDYDSPGYVVGVSCPCCGPADSAYYIARLSEVRRRKRVTYANIFSNGNWQHLNEYFISAMSASGRLLVLVTHWDKDFDCARKALFRNRVIVVPIGDWRTDRPKSFQSRFGRGGAVEWYCKTRAATRERFGELASEMNDAIFLIQLGPVSNVLVHHMFLSNRNNTYVDMGHSLDGILFHEPCREFMLGKPAATCEDMDIDWEV